MKVWLGEKRRLFQLRHRVRIPLERSVDHVCAVVHKEWHHRLVHRSVPWHIAWLPVSVTVHHLVELMEHRRLSQPPLLVRVRLHWMLCNSSAHYPVTQVRVVQQRTHMMLMVHHKLRALTLEATAQTSYHEVAAVEISDPATSVETLDGKLSDHKQTEKNSSLCARGSVRVIEVRAVGRAGHDVL